jgi:6-pyruvoyltetrahydropterin/6-carboxytetrahydropterin synthase
MHITRRLEFDAGHRIPYHESQCRHLHGHRYTLEVTLSGDVVTEEGQSDQGMVMDFGQVKAIAMAHLVDHWDHAFLVYANDKPVRAFLESLPEHKTVVLDAVPTAENLAMTAFRILAPHYDAAFGRQLRLELIRVYETPNCWAQADRRVLVDDKAKDGNFTPVGEKPVGFWGRLAKLTKNRAD